MSKMLGSYQIYTIFACIYQTDKTPQKGNSKLELLLGLFSLKTT